MSASNNVPAQGAAAQPVTHPQFVAGVVLLLYAVPCGLILVVSGLILVCAAWSRSR